MDFFLTAIIQALCLTPMALGIYVTMKIFRIPDITTDGSYTLGGVTTAILLQKNFNAVSVLPFVIVAGGLAGTLTGIIHTKLKINPLLAGILVMTALYSLNLTLMGRSNIPLIGLSSVYSTVRFIENENGNTLINLLFFITLISIMLLYVLKTDFGLAMRATGDSESMVRALGINTDRMKITGFAIANSLTACSAYFITQFQSFADINMGLGIVIIGLGSVIIAETIGEWLHLSKIEFGIFFIILGTLLFQLVLAFTLYIGVDANLLRLVIAAFVLLIVSLPRIIKVRA